MNEFSDILIKIQKSEYLSREDLKFAYNFILDGKANDIEIEDFLIGLNNKGITIDDIICGVEVLREKSFKVEVPVDAIDTCGTGGDNSGTFNISTAVTFVAAGAGAIVADSYTHLTLPTILLV